MSTNSTLKVGRRKTATARVLMKSGNGAIIINKKDAKDFVFQKGKIEFKVDKNGVINNFVGKLSFSKEQVVENIESLLSAISKMKPATAKGQFLRSLFVSSTMGAGLKIDLNSLSLS